MDTLITGNTHRFQLKALKDGVVWDLSAATVKILFKKPDNSRLSFNATIPDAINGVAQYVNLTTLLDKSGQWERSWEITDGSIVQESKPVKFRVEQGLNDN